jgi:hypothetical protein
MYLIGLKKMKSIFSVFMLCYFTTNAQPLTIVARKNTFAVSDNWIYFVGNPNPKFLLIEGKVENETSIGVPTKTDSIIWQWLIRTFPHIENNPKMIGIFQNDQNIWIYPKTAENFELAPLDLLRFWAKKNCSNDYANITFKYDVTVQKKYSDILPTKDTSLQFYDTPHSYYHSPNNCQKALTCSCTNDCCTNLNYNNNYCDYWVVGLVWDTIQLTPTSVIGQLFSNEAPQLVGYKLEYQFHNNCWDYFTEIDYLRWYESRQPKGYQPDYQYPPKAYYLDTLFNTLVIGEQNPQTGEWQGNFEAYTFAEDQPTTLFLKGRHDHNKRVGVWKYYNFYDAEKPILQTDSISSEGVFISSHETPFEGFSEAEYAQFAQTVQTILKK